MLQACPGREELQAVTKVSERAVAAYEVLTWHLHRQQEKIEQLKEAIRVRGGCRMLSDGDKCDCGLCTRDNEIEQLQQDKADLLEQLKDARKEISLLRDKGIIRELEQELEPLRRLRDAIVEVILNSPVSTVTALSAEEMAQWALTAAVESSNP